MKELEALEVMISFLEGAVEQQTEIVNKLDEEAVGVRRHIGDADYEEGKLNALAEALEEATMIKISFLKGNSK